MLKAVISPQKQKLEVLPQAIEEWMDAIRTYEKRKDASGKRTAIPDEIKTAALEAMLPQDLESHVQLNQSRFNTFDDLLEEINRYVEHKTGKSLKIVSAASALANQNALGDPMDVSSVGYKRAGRAAQRIFLEAAATAVKQGTKQPTVGRRQVRKANRQDKARTPKVQGPRPLGQATRETKGRKEALKEAKERTRRAKDLNLKERVLARKVRAKVSTILKKNGPRRTRRPNKDGK